jgi:putative tryptophan/tyrosine transport system substrate-binding protein
VKRREFITLAGGAAAAWPLMARAQQPGQIPRIGFISGGSPSLATPVLSGFTDGMRDLGYVEGKDFVMEWRFAEGNYDRFSALAEELVRSLSLWVSLSILSPTDSFKALLIPEAIRPD